MATKQFAFLFSARDKVTGPVQRMSAAVGSYVKSLAAAREAPAMAYGPVHNRLLAGGKVGSSFLKEQVGGGAGAGGGHGGMFTGIIGKLHSLLAVVHMVGEAFGELGSKIFEVGTEGAKFAIDSTAYKQNTQLALKTLLGSKEEAQKFMSKAISFASQTPFETKDVMKWSKNLLTGGFSTKEVPVLLQAIGDFGALNDMDTGVMERVIYDLREIKSIGHLAGRQMMSLGMAGLPTGKVYEKLGKMFGTTADGARKLEEAGKVDASSAIFAITDTLREMSGGRVGNLLKETSQGVTGLFSTIKSRPFELFKDMDETAGFEPFRQFLVNVAELLDPGGDFGSKLKSRLQDLFGSVFSTIFGPMAGGEGKVAMEAALTGILDVFSGIVGAVKTAWPYVKAFGEGLGAGLAGPVGVLLTVFRALDKSSGGDGVKSLADGFKFIGQVLGSVVGWVALFVAGLGSLIAWGSQQGAKVFGFVAEVRDAFDSLKGWLSERVSDFEELGNNLVQGLGTGLANGIRFLADPLGQLSGYVVDQLKSQLGIASPSKVFAQLGEYTAMGFAQGIEAGAPDAAAATAALVGVSPGGGGAGGGGVTVEITQSFSFASSADALRPEVMDRLKALTEEAVESALESLGLQLEPGTA